MSRRGGGVAGNAGAGPSPGAAAWAVTLAPVCLHSLFWLLTLGQSLTSSVKWGHPVLCKGGQRYGLGEIAPGESTL